MIEQKRMDKTGKVVGRTDNRAADVEADVEAAIVAGGDIVGTTIDDEPLVEGPNSK